ncbi:MAG: hypothetical protein AABY22_24745 [Nanoarchaeota archaeon]
MKTYWERRRENEERKRCPVCQSVKTHENSKYFTCENCNYILKKNGTSDK